MLAYIDVYSEGEVINERGVRGWGEEHKGDGKKKRKDVAF
jgi:hypothetical protein